MVLRVGGSRRDGVASEGRFRGPAGIPAARALSHSDGPLRDARRRGKGEGVIDFHHDPLSEDRRLWPGAAAGASGRKRGRAEARGRKASDSGQGGRLATSSVLRWGRRGWQNGENLTTLLGGPGAAGPGAAGPGAPTGGSDGRPRRAPSRPWTAAVSLPPLACRRGRLRGRGAPPQRHCCFPQGWSAGRCRFPRGGGAPAAAASLGGRSAGHCRVSQGRGAAADPSRARRGIGAPFSRMGGRHASLEEGAS